MHRFSKKYILYYTYYLCVHAHREVFFTMFDKGLRKNNSDNNKKETEELENIN